MPYSSNADLPPAVKKRYSDRCQSVFRRVFNENASKGDSTAFPIAHTAARNCMASVAEANGLDDNLGESLDSAQIRAQPQSALHQDGATDRQDQQPSALLSGARSGMAKSAPIAEAAPTKDGLPKKAYAYTPSNDPSTWKLKLYTADGKPDPDVIPGAAAALSAGGFRGQKADIPAEALANVKSKIRQAYRKWQGRKAEYPDSIKESEFREATAAEGEGAYRLREATVLLDKSAAFATVVFAPNGDALVIPSWDGAFDAAKAPLDTPDDTPESWEDVWDAQDAANLLSKLYAMKGGEMDEPDQMALLDKAIGALVAFMKAEGDEIGAPEEPGEAVSEAQVQAFLSEAGRRNSNSDLKKIQAVHDLTHDLGAVHAKGQPYAGMSEAKVTLDEAATPAEVQFVESAYESAAVVTLAEANPVFDIENRMVTITPIRPGWGNQRDNFFYPASTLKEATDQGLFNHKKMFRNHPRSSDKKELPERSVTDWFATTREAYWDAARQEPRVPIKVHEEADIRRFQEAPEQIAFSVLGGGSARPGNVNGKDGRVVEAFHQVGSVDWVTEAGAGGALVFAESAAEEFDMEIDKLTAEQLKEGNPKLFAQLTGIKEHDADAEGQQAEGEEKPAEGSQAAAEQKPEGEATATATASTETPAADADKAAEGEATDKPAEQAQTSESKDFISRAEFEAALARERDLPKIREQARKAVSEELASTTLTAKQRGIVAESFAEAGWGNGYVYTDEPALRGAVRGEATKAARLLGLSQTPSKVTGLGPTKEADDSGDSAVKVVESRIESKWGTESIPKPDRTVITTSEDEKGDLKESIGAVEERVAAKLGG